MKLRQASIFILIISLSARPAQSAAPESQTNPYHTVVEHNVFGLKPSPMTTSQTGETPPQIILNGIMTIFGDRRALFKTPATSTMFGPVKERSYMLAEGQRDGEIELLSVDMKAGAIKVNNHGSSKL